MSARYSTSFTLRLPIAESRICAALQAGFSVCCFLALVLISGRGYPWLAVLLSLPIMTLLPVLNRQPLVGAVVHWRRGNWSIERGGVEMAISLHPSSRVSPFAVFLCWCSESGVKDSVWLFADSAPADQQRRLRVRLALQ